MPEHDLYLCFFFTTSFLGENNSVPVETRNHQKNITDLDVMKITENQQVLLDTRSPF